MKNEIRQMAKEFLKVRDGRGKYARWLADIDFVIPYDEEERQDLKDLLEFARLSLDSYVYVGSQKEQELNKLRKKFD